MPFQKNPIHFADQAGKFGHVVDLVYGRVGLDLAQRDRPHGKAYGSGFVEHVKCRQVILEPCWQNGALRQGLDGPALGLELLVKIQMFSVLECPLKRCF